VISIANFNFLAEAIAARSAILLDLSKRYLVVDRLSPLLKANALRSLDDLTMRLRRRPTDPLWEDVIDALTTNETSFFRDEAPFQTLATKILPKLVADANQEQRITRIWSAGCSSGQEPYSLAMIVRDVVPRSCDEVHITATDISQSMLDRAEVGTYNAIEIGRGLSDSHRKRFFKQSQDQWIVRDELKSMISWQRFSLNQNWPPTEDFDLVLMRNVLVYFSEEERKKILSQTKLRMRQGGLLLLGGAEAGPLPREFFSAVKYDGVTYYRNDPS
jgi:chemotaxis protein methyltransferase CheR